MLLVVIVLLLLLVELVQITLTAVLGLVAVLRKPRRGEFLIIPARSFGLM
jgi:hypothetical protein